jgi:DNA-binding PadR family transcriptional regulator
MPWPKRSALTECHMVCKYVAMRHDANRHDDIKAKALTEAVVLILAALAPQPRHGYALMRDIERLSEGRISMSTGTLYGALRRLLGDGWIERFKQDDTSRDKQAYALTGAGRNRLKAELDRLNQLVRVGNLQIEAKDVG